MDSTSQSLTKDMSSKGKSLAKVKNSRGMSAKAYSAKAMTWKLETANALPRHEAGSIESSLPKYVWVH